MHDAAEISLIVNQPISVRKNSYSSKLQILPLLLIVIFLACTSNAADLQEGPLAKGRAALERKEYLAALRQFNEAISANPNSTDPYVCRAKAYFALGQLDEAVKDCNRALQIDHDSVDAYWERAKAFALKNDHDRAILDYSEVIRLDPNATGAYGIRGSLFGLQGRFKKAIADLNEAIRLDPSNVTDRTNRAACYYQLKDYKKSMADYNAAIALKPDSSFLYERRGAFWIELGDYARGISDLKMAIRLNPNDMARDFKATTNKPLNPQALEHGRREVRRMLHDRPNMAQYGKKADWLYEWAARKFAGEDLGRKIFWNSVEPPHPSNACHCSFPIAQIQIRKTYIEGSDQGKDCSFEVLWRHAVFELYNITNEDFFKELVKDANEGKLSKRDFVARMIKGESIGAQKTRAFYILTFLPWASEHQFPTHPVSWSVAWGSGGNDNLFLGQFTAKDGEWPGFERTYDQIMLQRLTKEGKYQEAVELAAKLYQGTKTPDERATIRGFQGYSYLCLNKLTQAIECYSEVIRLDPNNASAHIGRSDAYRKSGKVDLALADSNEAVRLEPKNPDGYRVRSFAYYTMGDKARANADILRYQQLLKATAKGKR